MFLVAVCSCIGALLILGEREFTEMIPREAFFTDMITLLYKLDCLKMDLDRLDCAANDEMAVSNALFFERQRNWSSILIEANSSLGHSLLQHHIHVYA